MNGKLELSPQELYLYAEHVIYICIALILSVYETIISRTPARLVHLYHYIPVAYIFVTIFTSNHIKRTRTPMCIYTHTAPVVARGRCSCQ